MPGANTGGVAEATPPDDLTAIRADVGQITHVAEHLDQIVLTMRTDDRTVRPTAKAKPKPTGMETLLSAAGRSFLRAFGAALVVMIPGMLVAPNLKSGIAIGVAAIVASIAAGFRALQEFIPELSIGEYLPRKLKLLGKYVDSFVRGFLAAFLTSIIGILSMPTLSFSKSLIVGALIGAFAAAWRAVQGVLLDRNEAPQGIGIPVPLFRVRKR